MGNVCYDESEKVLQMVITGGLKVVKKAKHTINLLAVFMIMMILITGSVVAVHADADYKEQGVIQTDGYAWTYRLYSDHAELKSVYLVGDNKEYPENIVIPDYTPSELGSLPITAFDDFGYRKNVNTTTKSITLNHFITKIPKEACLYCLALQEFSFGDAPVVTEIGESAFAGTPLTRITLPESLRVIGKQAFESAALKKVVLPKNLKTIGDEAFVGMGGGDYTYAGIDNFDVHQTQLIIPDSVTNIGHKAFGYIFVDTLKVGKGIKTLDAGRWFYGDDAYVKKITGCENVTTVKSYPYGLESIIVYKNVKKISPDAIAWDTLQKCSTITVKSKKLTKSGVKNCIRNYTDIKTITFKIKVGSASQNKKYVKKYKKFMTKKNMINLKDSVQPEFDLKHYVKKIVVK